MDFTEDDKKIVGTIAFRAIPSKPGSMSLYIGADLAKRLQFPINTVLSFKYDKKKNELCLKQLEY
jgi:hypothetical protein